ncbi:FRAS1-related extracellular matrix protein 2 [Bagarius yarrelli]|uniref:FRAS1-related extracellular matrix protein 2 n=1 Tax=Bagarius yarrelli TaxID=175774 RepID=A0A556V7D1_BAGYA|nr:FRAS1-related extracellular matrix protein 2 [Bagarius yarrelli]
MMGLYLCIIVLSSVTGSYGHYPGRAGLSYAHRSELSEDSILVANNRIRVPFGRSVFIDPINDLVTEVQPGDKCSLVVLENDPLSQRPGHLSPKKFPCEFGPNDVKYSHLGSRSPAEDRVRLQLRYDTQTETVIIPFMLEIEVLFTQLEIVTKNMPLSVDKLHGISNSIDRRILEFTYDRNSEQCEVTSLAATSALPRYGELTNKSKLEKMMDCDAFLIGGIRYKHTSILKSPNRDYVPMVVELRNKENNLLKQEFFHIMIRIREGLQNRPPKPSFVAMMMMEIDQFVMTALTPDMLAAEDTESDPDDLIFNITTPFSFEEGYIVSTDDRNLPITSFYQRDIKDLRIAYKPPSMDSDTERIFQIEFEVLDTDGGVSEPFAFMIIIKPMNTLAPVVTKNTGQLLYEGQSRPLFTENNLEISDEDNLENVRITVVDGLRHGDLTILGSSTKYFTPADLQLGIVVYKHDGSDTYSDNIIFRMTDGKNEVEFLFPITIVPTDDEPPIINANTGLVVFKNQMIPISPLMLSAADIDSEDSTIKFTIEHPLSLIGEVLLRQSEAPEDPSSWKFNLEVGLYEKTVTEWLQKDIADGKLFYRHTGPHITEAVTDQFIFKAEDDADPPNQSDENTFLIRILPIDDVPPVLFPGTSLHMTVFEYQMTSFNKNVLRYTDMDSDDRDLKYTITQAPTDTDESNSIRFGSVVLTEHPDTEIREFTQAQVNHHKISYSPPDIELGIATHLAQIRFIVEDAAGNSVNGTLTILVQPVNNKPPEITNTGFTVFERGMHIITNSELNTTDIDTDRKQISFTLSQSPQHGQVQLSFADLIKGNAFSLADISEGRISYVHNGDETTSDTFKLDVSDGVHIVPVSVRIVVKPIDDEMPTLTLSAGTLGSHLSVLENSVTEITVSVIQGKDEDTDDLRLTFIVEDAPAYGELLVNGIPSNVFTQADIINGMVTYTHTSGEIGLSSKQDHFNLTLNDMSDEWAVGGNKITGVSVYVTILPVDNQAPEVTVIPTFNVTEGDKNIIGGHQIIVKDADTLTEEILCTVIVQPNSGYLENVSPAPGSEKSRSGTAISAFSIRDINDGQIRYVQSIHKGVEPVEDTFTFRCSDGVNFSGRNFFPIAIIPTNDEKPEIILKDFVVMEGMNIIIDTAILNGVDADIPVEDLTFLISKPPKHGFVQDQLITGSLPVTNFTLQQIKEASSIIYEHDDSESTEDKFNVILTDGKHSVEGTIIIIIISVDDETPRLAINDGLEIEIGEKKEVNNKILKATDLDSEDSTLTFVIRYGPSQGILQQKTEHGSFRNITVGMNFTQMDLDRGHIFYTHDGQEGIRDLIKFDVTDGSNPLIDRYFYITVNNIDMVFPEVISKGVSLKEGGSVMLTTDLLSTSDLNSPDENLVFTITRAPVRGHLESTDHPGMPIVSFTQLQLAGSKIYYIHTSDDEIKMDSFEFEVTDGYNPVFRTFRVSIVDVDNKKPVLTVHELQVLEGQSKLITPFELTVEDQDTAEEFLKFSITQLPIHGKLLFNNSNSVMSFTKQDLNENLISYKHDGTESFQDSFSFTVTDGTHTDFYVFPDTVFETHRPQVMKITISSIDNGVPQIVVNKGVQTLKVLPTSDLGYLISRKMLKAEDRDSSPETLVFHITTQPENGYLIKRQKGNDSINSFTQADIDDLNICYVLKHKNNATSDTFIFDVKDNGISTLDGSAEKDKDFYGSFQKQVQFNPGQTTATWRIKIISDEKFEQSETFNIILSEPVMGTLESPAVATVEIVDPEDESTVFIPQARFVIEEDIGEVLVPLHRGGDVSEELMVLCYTLQDSATGTVPSTVLSFSDYISRPEGQSSMLRFEKGEKEKLCRVLIIDDSLYEPEESFNVSLSVVVGGHLGSEYPSTRISILPDLDDAPVFYFGDAEYYVDESQGHVDVRVWRTGTDLSKAATVTVRSRKTDPVSAEVPKMEFKHRVLTREESDRHLTAVIQRSGDITHQSTVRCYTRQGSAEVASDFEERPNTDASIITFLPGETEKPCVLVLVDDSVYEEEEEMRLVLGSATSDSKYGASVGTKNETLIRIKDIADKPIIKFAKTRLSVSEPKEQGKMSVVRIPVLRMGDSSKVSVVRVHTKDGSAESGVDYHPISLDVEFKEGETEHFVEVEVLFDGAREMREAFTVHLKPDENMVAEIQMTKAIVYIEESNSMADVTFPSLPHVVSLLHYDDPRKTVHNAKPPAGYPVVCVTACNPRHPEYEKTGLICASEHISDSLTHYRWLVSAPTGSDGVTSPMREMDIDTFFTNSKIITLDSIYFQAGSRVQCAARAVNSNGEEGLELSSPVISISMEEAGMCHPRKVGTVGAEPFSAKLHYTGTEDPEHANLIKLSVTLPHTDGMLPVLSTRALSNFELILSPDGSRVGNHRCSNLLDFDEVHTRHGFLSKATKSAEHVGESAPYQYNATMRGQNTLRFYRNLNLEACLWQFVSYYDMSELLTDCGGSIGTDGQVLNLVQSFVTLRVPLHVSYVFHSPVGTSGWQHFDLQSELRLTFVYDTAILWKDGIGSPPQAELHGALYPASMRINNLGRLVVNFRTKAQFYGLFVESHLASSLSSTVMSTAHPGLTFNLSLVRTEPTYNQPVQQWTFTSDFAVSDPVALEFSLNTQMFLLSKRSLWLSDGSMGFGQESDAAFSEGDTIYVRVMVDPVQNLGDSFHCNIEKVFLCTGADGYVPKYNPTQLEFGCLADSPSLLYRFKIIDKAQPETQALHFGNQNFNAVLAVDDPSALSLVKQPGSDGFRLDSAPLFQVAAGREWYIHTIYTVRSRDSANRGIGKRSVEYHSFTGHKPRSRRSNQDIAELISAEHNRGTNIMHIALVHQQSVEAGAVPPEGLVQNKMANQDSEKKAAMAAGISVGLLLIGLVGAVFFLLVRLKRRPEKKVRKKSEKEESTVSGSVQPVRLRSGFEGSDGSEV